MSAEHLYSELGRHANSSMTDAEKDRAIVATVAHVVERDFGYMMGRDCWVEYTGKRSKHFGVAR